LAIKPRARFYSASGGSLSTSNRYNTDPGVAVYFRLNRERLVLAQDRFETGPANLRSVGLVVGAMRTMERHGGGALADRAAFVFGSSEP
jgi:hypothetical protein